MTEYPAIVIFIQGSGTEGAFLGDHRPCDKNL